MAEPLTDEMRILATQQVVVFQKSLWKAMGEIKFGHVPCTALLANHIIQTILKVLLYCLLSVILNHSYQDVFIF
jgi:hypothetical protein